MPAVSFNVADAEACMRLRSVLQNLSQSDRDFAGKLMAALDQYGSLSEGRRKWIGILTERGSRPPQAARAAPLAVGDLGGILQLFGRAARHLKTPAVELGVTGYAADRAIRVNVATDAAKVPGSLTVLSAARFDRGGEYPERDWFGRILKNGTFQPSREVSADPAYLAAVVTRLQAFAADPSRVGAEDGLLTGRCCFCRKSLRQEKSTAVGYGAKCAKNFGLAWGGRPAEFAGEAVS